MDPASALGVAANALQAAKVAYEIGESLYNFVRDVKNQESIERGFASEVKALSAACHVVGTRLKEIVHDYDNGKTQGSKTKLDSALLWHILEEQVSECQITIDQLSSAVSCLTDKDGKEATFLTQAFRQIKLNMKTRDIAQSRNRIQSHTASLQIVLQAIAIEVSYVVPQRADQQLRTQLSILYDMKSDLEALRTQRDAQENTLDTREDEVLRASSKVMSSGETLYAASQSGLSVHGDLAPGKKQHIFEWIDAANEIGKIDEEMSNEGMSTVEETDTPSIFSPSHDGPTDVTENTSAAGQVQLERIETEITPYEDEDEEADGYILEAAQIAITDGRDSFRSGDFQEANDMLEEALRLVRELSRSKQAAICDHCEMRYMLGVCAFHLQAPAAAEVALLTIVKETPNARVQNNERRQQVLDAGHMLSQTYLKLGMLQKAFHYCDNALRGRERLLGKDSDPRYESLALMARINALEGKTGRVNILTRLIPESKKNELTQRFQNLGQEIELLRPLRQRNASRVSNLSADAHSEGTTSPMDEKKPDFPQSRDSVHSNSISMVSPPGSVSGQEIKDIKDIPQPVSRGSSPKTSGPGTRPTGGFFTQTWSPSDRTVRRASNALSPTNTSQSPPVPSIIKPPPLPLTNLRVRVLRAERVFKPDTFKDPDPYVRLSVTGQPDRYSAVQKKTTNPTWNETFYLRVDQECYLKFNVVDARKTGKDGSVGNGGHLGCTGFKVGSYLHRLVENDEEITRDLHWAVHLGPTIKQGRLTFNISTYEGSPEDYANPEEEGVDSVVERRQTSGSHSDVTTSAQIMPSASPSSSLRNDSVLEKQRSASNDSQEKLPLVNSDRNGTGRKGSGISERFGGIRRVFTKT